MAVAAISLKYCGKTSVTGLEKQYICRADTQQNLTQELKYPLSEKLNDEK